MSKLAKRPYAREDESLDQYLQEIGEVSLLTAEEEVALAKRIKKGDQDALEKLTKAQRQTVALRFAGGLSLAETARAMGKGEGAVKSLQHDALIALRKMLAPRREFQE